MPDLRNVPRTEWRTFFDRMSASLLGKRAEIEVAALDLGDQVIAEWLPVLGITYDSHDDAIDVALDRVNHSIRGPKEVLVQETPAGVESVAVVDANGTRHIVRLKEPLRLQAPTPANKVGPPASRRLPPPGEHAARPGR